MIRIGLSGCGAVSARYYAPALLALEAAGEARLVAVFDPDAAAMRAVCDRLPDARPCATYDELLAAGLDLVLVASPPRRHAEQAIAALAQGVAVHCEKPLAMSGDEAARTVAAAQAAGRPLTEGLVRRRFPSGAGHRRSTAPRGDRGPGERGGFCQVAALVLEQGGEFQDAFTAQLRAAISGAPPAGRGQEPGLAALGLIDRCYARRQPMALAGGLPRPVRVGIGAGLKSYRARAAPPAAARDGPEVSLERTLLQTGSVWISWTRAEVELGYVPVVSFGEGLRRSIAWLESAGYPVVS